MVMMVIMILQSLHDDVIKWKHFPVPGEFPAQRPVTRSFDVFFDLHLIKRSSKTLARLVIWDAIAPLLRHCNEPFIQHDMSTKEQSQALWVSLLQ